MKKALKITGVVILCLILAFPIYVPVANNIIAAGTANEILSVPLPEKTEYIEKISAAGKLSGNGNGVSHFGAVLIKSGLSEEELKDYYGGYSVEKQKGHRIEQIEHGNVYFETDVTGEDYYMVYSYSVPENDLIRFLLDFDLRGH